MADGNSVFLCIYCHLLRQTIYDLLQNFCGVFLVHRYYRLTHNTKFWCHNLAKLIWGLQQVGNGSAILVLIKLYPLFFSFILILDFNLIVVGKKKINFNLKG